ncbi:MAG: hypothetical protein WC615_01640 [Mucilaginibacter sp.]|jgi:hypothetical protein|uniref:hypothetical protein n=1 Tax=Mucilaginibacter sp. TaxID=1882438 RepID=UPI003563B6B8
MKSSFLISGGAAFGMSLILSYLLISLIAYYFRKKHYPKASPNLAQSIVLAGRLLASLILITGLFAPVRDFLLISAGNGGLNSAACWSFLLICCCGLFFAYCIAAGLEGVLSGQIFKGQSLSVELSENNIGLSVVRAVMLTGLAIVLLFSLGIFLQAFIPTPAIPTIR